MMRKLKPEEILNYLKSRSLKENKAKKEINIKNNNLLKNISLYDTLNKFNINLLPINNINKALINPNKENKEQKNTDISKVLVLKKINLPIDNSQFSRRNNRINIDVLKKHLNIKKKKYNKGIDFCSYFLQPKNNFYINVLNEGIINNFIAFFTKAKYYYLNTQSNIQNDIDYNSLKISNIKYPIFIPKALNDKEVCHFEVIKKEKNKNLYEKCLDILKNENCENFCDNEDINCRTFLKGLNHDIRYDLELYLENKIRLIDLNVEENELFEKGNYLNKYNFQFIKKVDYNIDNNNVLIDKSLIIPDKKQKYSFNEPRLMYPLFIKGIFDKINIYNQFSFYKNGNISKANKDLNLFFEKSMDRPKEININKIYSEFQNSESCSNILNGYYLINPLQQSINNRELFKKTNIPFLPKKFKKDLKSILGSKFNYNKYRRKRNYLNIINNENIISNKKEEDVKLVLISEKTAKNYINRPEQYIIISNNMMEFDILFDINICGKIYFASEFYDQFQYNGYNSICDLINKNYLYYTKFYIFLIDDEKMNRNIVIIKSDKIVNSINQIIKDKFSFLINGKYEFKVIIKILDNPHLINYEINHLYEELLKNNSNNELSIYNNKIIYKLLNEIISDTNSITNGNLIKTNINEPKVKFNLYENYILNSVKNSELKDEILNMINKKYSKLNII